LDLTFGAGGHTRGLLNRNEKSVVYALDRDLNAIELAHQMAKEYPCENKFLFKNKEDMILK
jgi:16S rRNA C1402 N4-methylase RsmH